MNVGYCDHRVYIPVFRAEYFLQFELGFQPYIALFFSRYLGCCVRINYSVSFNAKSPVTSDMAGDDDGRYVRFEELYNVKEGIPVN